MTPNPTLDEYERLLVIQARAKFKDQPNLSDVEFQTLSSLKSQLESKLAEYEKYSKVIEQYKETHCSYCDSTQDVHFFKGDFYCGNCVLEYQKVGTE